ncbi:hypothetical protein BCR42DRAFT_417417 [Absidia repens]|uniref:Uncharacterized protein n=1 Tax=Absidia repens TaxID=90262 RepID=A0A1X2IDV1_9FUNG|nr:hypothetical protein BCR42DRAFT_417417 [Absidia repens]
MIWSTNLLPLLLFMNCLILMSAPVWGQDTNHADNDNTALEYNEKPADVLNNNDHGTTKTPSSMGEFVYEENDQDNDDDDEASDDDEEDDMDIQGGTTYDIDEEPLSGGYYGLLQQGNSKEQEQGDDLGEELFVEFEYDEEDDDDTTGGVSTNDSNDGTTDGLLFEDDEAPLDFKNNEETDLDQLLFEASQKDITNGWEYQHDPLDKTATHDDIDQLLANADDALYVDPQDDAVDADGHPDHVTDTLIDSIFQEQQQNMNPINHNHYHTDEDDDLLPPLPPGIFAEHDTPDDQLGYSSSDHQNYPSQYKLPLFGILVLLILLYKVSNKSQGGIGSKFLEKEEKGLPLHNKDLNTQDSMSYPNNGSILVSSPNTATQHNPQQQHQQQPTSAGGHGYHGRRSSSSSSMSSGRKSSLSGVAASAVGVHGGHTRRISLGHPMLPHTIKESKWEDEWDDKAEKRRQ